METVQVSLPTALVEAAQFDGSDLSHETAKLLALELFRKQRISLGRAAELCATPIEAFMDFAADHGVPPLQYGLNELEEDRRSFDELGV
jgi:predicted HTH domain antitoxin